MGSIAKESKQRERNNQRRVMGPQYDLSDPRLTNSGELATCDSSRSHFIGVGLRAGD